MRRSDLVLLDAGDVSVAAKAFARAYLHPDREDDVDEDTARRAAALLERGAYHAERAAARLRALADGRCDLCHQRPKASGSDACDLCIDEAEELAAEEHRREAEAIAGPYTSPAAVDLLTRSFAGDAKPA